MEEYARLISSGQGESDTFQVKQEAVPEGLANAVERLARVERLREVRALTGFKRIYQPVSVTDPGRGTFGDLCDPASPRPWLPAAEVRGEGIFLSLKRSCIEDWLATYPAVRERDSQINEANARQWAARHGDASAPR